MLYHVRVHGHLPGGTELALPQAVVVEVDDEADVHVLSCLLLDAAAVTAAVAYLHDLGLVVVGLRRVDEPGPGWDDPPG